MRIHLLRWAVASLAVAAVAVLTPLPASASGFQLVEQNGSGLGNAFAGQAAGVRDASAVFFNPAALTRLEGKAFAISVNPIGVSTEFADQGSTAPNVPGLPFPAAFEPGNGGDAGGWTPVPSVYLSWQAAEQVWVGFGASVPFGLTTDWASDWLGRFHALKSEVMAINLNPTVAFKLGDSISIGAGADYQRLEATLTQGIPYGGLAFAGAAAIVGPQVAAAGIVPQLGSAGMAREGSVSIEGDNWAWGFNAGVLVELGEGTSVGVSYRSEVEHDLEGDATFDNAPTFATDGPLGPIGSALNANFSSGPVTTSITLPATLSVAAAYETEKYELLADWTWTGWSSIEDLTIDRVSGGELSSVALQFEDTWRAGLGVNLKLNDKTKLRLGTAYDKAPVQDEYRTPRLPDHNRVWVAGGFELKLTERSSIDVGYAHIFVEEASSNLPNMEGADSTPKGDLIGTYSANVNIFSVQYAVSF
jgi:long-chain fatty acid transport protein